MGCSVLPPQPASSPINIVAQSKSSNAFFISCSSFYFVVFLTLSLDNFSASTATTITAPIAVPCQ